MNPTLLDPDYLSLLACPQCKGPLSQEPDPPALVCSACALSFPFEDGVPVLLVEQAKPLGGQG